MRESTQEQRARVLLTRAGFLVLKVGRQGWPDSLVTWGQRHFWVEWKTPKGRLTKGQLRRIPAMVQKGEKVLVATNADNLFTWALAWMRKDETDSLRSI